MPNFNKLLNNVKTTPIKYQELVHEDRYKELWDNAPVTYHTLNTEGIITSINKTGAKLLGYQVEEMVGRTIFDFMIPRQREQAKIRFQKKIKGIVVPKLYDRIYLSKEGKRIYVSTDDVLEYDNTGKINGLRTTIIDITQQKQSEEQLKYSHKAQSILNRILNISLEELPLEEMLKKIFNALISIPWISLEAKGGKWPVPISLLAIVCAGRQPKPEKSNFPVLLTAAIHANKKMFHHMAITACR